MGVRLRQATKLEILQLPQVQSGENLFQITLEGFGNHSENGEIRDLSEREGGSSENVLTLS
jgi:hypothetical protein